MDEPVFKYSNIIAFEASSILKMDMSFINFKDIVKKKM